MWHPGRLTPVIPAGAVTAAEGSLRLPGSQRARQAGNRAPDGSGHPIRHSPTPAARWWCDRVTSATTHRHWGVTYSLSGMSLLPPYRLRSKYVLHILVHGHSLYTGRHTDYTHTDSTVRARLFNMTRHVAHPTPAAHTGPVPCRTLTRVSLASPAPASPAADTIAQVQHALSTFILLPRTSVRAGAAPSHLALVRRAPHIAQEHTPSLPGTQRPAQWQRGAVGNHNGVHSDRKTAKLRVASG